MPRSVAIRLGTEGKAQVKADFVEIGDTGDAQAKRWSRSFDSATKDVEAALQRQANAAAKMSLVASQTPTQVRINTTNSTGFGQYEGTARESAAAFRELFAAEEQAAAKANALRAAIDPVFAAQQRFNKEIGEARALISSGNISLDEYVAKLRMEQAALDAVGGTTKKAGNAFAAAAPQIQDLFVQISMGGNPLQAFVVQGGQLAGQLQYAGGKAQQFANILMGPWGIAAQVALLVLSPFVAKLFEGNNALDEAIKKLKEDAEASEVNRQAKIAFAHSVEGVAQAIRDSTDATRKSIAADRSAVEQNNINARANLAEEMAIRAKTAARLEDARAILQAEINASRAGGERSEVATMGVATKQAQVDAISRQLADQTTAVARAQENLERSRLALAADQAKVDVRNQTDPIARINKMYDDQVAALMKAKAAAVDQGRTVGAISRQQFADIERNRQAALKAEQERQRAANQTTNQIGRNVTLSEARGIAESIGGRVTSGVRSREEQQRLYDRYMAYKNGTGPWAALAAKPGTSNHESGQALDIAKSGGVTLAKLVAAYRQAGVSLSEALDEGDHYHIAFRKTGEAARAAAQDRKDAAKEAREAAQAEKDLTSDLKEVVGAYDPARAAAEAYADTLAKIDTLVRAGKLTIDEGNGLRLAAYHADAKKKAEEGYETFKKLFGTDDPMGDAVEGARRNISDRVDKMAEQDEAKVKAVTSSLDELRSYGSDFVSTVLSEDTWSSWGNAGKTILNSLKNEFITLALLNPLKNLINGDKALPTLSSAIGNIGKLFKPGTNAAGTEFWSGGMSLVGENGPEIVSMPRGSRVTTAQETRRLFANDNPSPSVTHNHFSGNLMTPEFWERINAGDAGAAMQGAAGGAAMSQADGTRAAARRLGRFR
ncbi:D-alanyl-D-alanine carboxypeptidase family protein [Sphingomonas sp. CV7422]|uniref:D-alanyl-D-alanine carboxypeptidase family protein n=1 Tax=Sphingomonas sp. CV7422 TaxID=3018036 RepID=UPI0022FEC401|nr:D-alanyl-D-alanine carboxypeptidase family protein [Sphingomonas sp. CV7422]